MPFHNHQDSSIGFYRSFFLLFGCLGLLAFVVVGLNGCFKKGHAGAAATNSTGANVSFTRYTQQAEWFVEYAPLVQGQK